MKQDRQNESKIGGQQSAGGKGAKGRRRRPGDQSMVEKTVTYQSGPKKGDSQPGEEYETQATGGRP